MRIIAGKAKGTRLAPPRDKSVRPTLDRVREALFSILGPDIDGALFLDIFAGTGANGIEALSRGAAHCDFVDTDLRSLELIRENLKKTGFIESAGVFQADIPDRSSSLKSPWAPYDIIFADPPRDFCRQTELFAMIHDLKLLKADGKFVIECPTKSKLDASDDGFSTIRSAKYGDTTLVFFELSTPCHE